MTSPDGIGGYDAVRNPQPADGELQLNTCPACRGQGTLPGRNFVVQGYVDPNCWHCNGQGVVVPPTQPEWVKRLPAPPHTSKELHYA